MFKYHVAHRMSPVDRGRCLVLAIIAITLLGGFFFGVLPAASESLPFFTGAILAFCAVAALLYAMWRGQLWARWFLVGIYVVGLAFRLTLIVRAPEVLDIARAAQQFLAALLLATPPSVGAFLAAQRNPRTDI
jgi:nicotinamide riboside transporter PnuC